MHAHTLRQGWLAVLKHFIMCVQTKIYTSSCPLSRGHTGHVTTCIMEVSHISTCWLQRTPACDWLQGINHSNETRKRSQNDSHACEAAGRLRPLLLVGVINSVSTQEADRLNMYDNNPDVLCVQSVHMWLETMLQPQSNLSSNKQPPPAPHLETKDELAEATSCQNVGRNIEQ